MGVEKVPDETEGGCKWSQKVTMTTLRGAPTRHRHTENLSGNRCRYLPKIASREEEGLGAKNNYNYCIQKQRQQNDWLLRKGYKITRALLNPKTAAHSISGGDLLANIVSCLTSP